MIYLDIIECLRNCEEHLNEGGGKITSILLKNYDFTDQIKDLIKQDYKIVWKLVDFYYTDFKNKIGFTNELTDALEQIEFIKVRSNDKKTKLIEFNDVVLPWLKSGDFFVNIWESNCPDIVNPEEIKSIVPIDKFIPRENQKEAFDRLESKGLETGIHCQATGCGKSFIIIKYIDYAYRTLSNPKVILFTERVNILSDLFSFKKGKVEADMDKLVYWKNLGVGDLTKFNIINRVTNKKKDWDKQLIESKGPTLLVINRAFLTLGKKYKEFKSQHLNLVLHDECHNTSSSQCHEFLLKCKSIGIPIVGFSATPLRTGKDDKPKLLEIYGNKSNELELLTNYNMIYAINKNLILAPEFFWYQIESYNKETSENKNTELVTQQELGSVLELLNHLIPLLPNKKLIGWCGTIGLAKKWKALIETSYKQRKNLVDFTFGLDTSETNTGDYEKFKASEGSCILFCANKHREGSDIRLLDGCIFLDKVKERGAIPFIQSIGRVLRLCPETPNKLKGVVIDGFVKEVNNYERQFVDKIIGYYMALENLTGLNESEGKTKYEQYVEMRDIVQFDKDKEIINMKLGGNLIKIHCNKLEWDEIVGKFDKILQDKIKLSVDEVQLFEFNKLKAIVKKMKFVNKEDYFLYAVKKGLDLKPENKFYQFWAGWYDFLSVNTEVYPKTKSEWKTICNKHKIKNEKQYKTLCVKLKLPAMPEELYKDFTNFTQEFNVIVNVRR